jgi:hypothetical protein
VSAQDTRDTVDASASGEELEDVLLRLRRNIELDLNVALPAHVLAYNPATQRATVQLGMLPVMFVEDEEVVGAPIVCPDVPVLTLGGSLGYVSFQLVPGDSGLVVFSDRCLAAWLKLGAPTDPLNGRTHALGDGVFIPGVRPVPDAITPPTDATATVVEGSLVRLGQGATAGVVLDASGLAAALTTAVTALGIIAAAPIPEPPLPGAGAAIDGILAVLIPVLQAIAVSTKVYAAPVPTP